MHKQIITLGLMAVSLAIVAAPLAAAETAKPAKPEYQVVDGAVLVFGHRLETENPLPKIGHCETCSAIGFVYSPDERWVMIISDVRFTDNDIWLYDTSTGAKPRRVVDKRRGKHLIETDWLSNRIFEIRWGGMGYTTSLLFDVANPGEGKALSDLLLYDVERDVYARFHNVANEYPGYMIEVGSAFSPAVPAERFAIALDMEYLSDWAFQIDSVEIDGAHLVVTYDTKARGKVTDRFPARVLGGAQ